MPQRSLVRLFAADGMVCASLGSGPGRGAYACPSSACLAGVVATGRLAKALRAGVAVPSPERLRAMVCEAAERKVAALLGQARRMGRVASGQEAVGDRVERRKASLLLLTRDAPEGADQVGRAATAAGIPVARALTRKGLGAALGVSPRWAAVVDGRELTEGLEHYLGIIQGVRGAGRTSADWPIPGGGGQGGRD